LPRGKI